VIKPTGTRLLCVQYEKPEETPGGIIIPQGSRRDTSNQLWEVVAVGPKAEEALGFAVDPGSIVKTRWGEGVDLGVDLEGTHRPLFILDADRVFNVIPASW
jgi:co-chaperonin GroES (HSP10)